MEQSLYADYVRTFFPALVTSVVEKLNDETRQSLPYLYKSLLTPEYTSDSRWSSILARYNRVSADVVALDSELPVKSRDSIEVVTGDIPKIGMKMYLTEKQMKDVAAMIAARRPEAQIVDKIFTDLPRVIEGVYETIEGIFLSELSSGVGVAPRSGGVGVRVDMKFYDANKFGVVKKWSEDASANALDDLQRVFDKAMDDGNVITDVYADDAFLKAFYSNEQVRQQYAFNQGFVGDKIPVLDLEKAQEVVRRKWGAQLHRVARKIRSELNGVRQSGEAWAKGTAAFTCDQRLGSLVWTDLVESSRPVPNVTYQTADEFILVSKYAQTDPWREFTSSQAMVVPVLNNVDRIYLLDSATVQA